MTCVQYMKFADNGFTCISKHSLNIANKTQFVNKIVQSTQKTIQTLEHFQGQLLFYPTGSEQTVTTTIYVWITKTCFHLVNQPYSTQLMMFLFGPVVTKVCW